MKPVNILAVTSWAYSDGLVQSAVLPYVPLILSNLPEGSSIGLITQEKKQFTPQHIPAGLTVLPLKHHDFGWKALFANLRVVYAGIRYVKKHRVKFIHAWCTPAGVNAYLISRFTGTKLVLDSFEPHADPMVEGGAWPEGGIAYKILKYYERRQLKRSFAAICNVSAFIPDTVRRYGVSGKRYFVKPACVDLNRFNPETAQPPKELQDELAGKIVCVYAGKFGGLYLERETFDFVRAGGEKWGEQFRFLLLSGHSEEEIAAYCAVAGVNRHTVVHRFVAYAEVPHFLKLASFAICPMKPLPSRRFATPIKNGEYWAMGLPVVITKNISDDSDIIAENNAGYVLKDLNDSEYGKALNVIENLLSEDKILLQNRIRKLAGKYRNFSIAAEVYQQIYNPENFRYTRKN